MKLHDVVSHHAIQVLRRAVVPVVLGMMAMPVMAEDVSAPVILQYFEGSYRTIENRTPDIFAAGYGSVYTPPPGRADQGNFSVGYDQYDRFDLGKPGNPTLYGTETGIKTTINGIHRAGLNYYVDLVLNHAGYSNYGSVDGDGHSFVNAGGYPGLAITLPWDIDGDFHSAYDGGVDHERLAGLLDIAQEKAYYFVRNPVPGYNNLPGGTTSAFGRMANVPDENNRRFYPDRNLQPIMVYDPVTGEHDIAIYPFNPSNPLAGDPTEETAMGYLMRNAQWLVQDVGVDGFRLDAAKHVTQETLHMFDRAVYRSSTRQLLNGQQRDIFSFSEVYDGQPGNLQQYVVKTINHNDPGTIGANRDTLDFPLFFALRGNLSKNGISNSWYNVQNASLDYNDNQSHDGSQGVMFVSSHDDVGPEMDNVAYAYVLMHPGNALVYFNGKEFGNGRDFPKPGRGDALGGLYGNSITNLLDIRNTHGRGNYHELWIEKESLAYEREGSAIVMLSNRGDAGYDERTFHTDFPENTRLVELTGNAANASTDPFNDIKDVIKVGPGGNITARFLRNKAPGTDNYTGNGYLVYGLAAPRGSVSLGGVSQTIAGQTPTDTTNGTTRLSDIHVVTGNSMRVTLNTQAMIFQDDVGSGQPATYHDRPADGNNALLKLDEGLDLNNSGAVDNITPGQVAYGFEQFVTDHQPGYDNLATGNGTYAQDIDTSSLSEGMHYLTVRAFRYRPDSGPDAGPAIFTDWRESLYIDRLKPVSGIDSFNATVNGVNENRALVVRSLDETADNMHVLFDLPAGESDSAILAMINNNSQTQQIDRDLFQFQKNGLTSGNHVATIVTYEITGNYNIQRMAGLFTSTIFGAGLGDTNFDGYYSPQDISIFGNDLNNNNVFNPAGDLDGDGLINLTDLTLLGQRLHDVGADQPTIDAYNQLVSSVPEPGGLLLIMGWGMGLMSRRRRSTRRKSSMGQGHVPVFGKGANHVTAS
ncbi:MAG: hypothetical protein IT447_08335 [Phycisphaerales bacterium]|jgi:glycosidase|nr:hypothetical protein [Phycisphaerales bacterium]